MVEVLAEWIYERDGIWGDAIRVGWGKDNDGIKATYRQLASEAWGLAAGVIQSEEATERGGP